MHQSSSLTRSSLIPLLAVLATAGLIALILYWPTLRLPLIYDDLLHIRIAGGLDLLSVWAPTKAFGFYRPLTFLPLLLIEDIFGHYPAPLLHGLNVFQHVANVILLALLSWRLWRRLHWTLATALLLALFPFSYQAIAVYGHNVHPTTAGLLLLALHTYLSAIASSGRQALWWLITTALFILALLSHESAILFGPLAALVQWNAHDRLPPIRRYSLGPDLRRQVSQPWFIFFFAGIVYAIAYRFLPLIRAPQASFEGAGLWNELLYVIQAAVYPLAWFGRWLPDEPLVAAATVLFGLAVVIGLTFWSAKIRTNRLPLLLGWSWWTMASLLIVLALPASYLLHGPRLLYLASIGLALLWPVLLEPIYRLSRFGRLLWAATLAFVLLASWLFVRDRLDAYARLTEPVAELQSVTQSRPAGEGIVFVNLPDWLAPARSQYPIGVELVAMLGNYLFVEELVDYNLASRDSAGSRPVQAVKVPDLLTNAGYNYGIHDQPLTDRIVADKSPAGSHVFVTTYEEAGPATSYRGRLTPEVAALQPLATMGPYELLSADAFLCEHTVELSSIWRLSAATGQTADLTTTSLLVQLLDAEGRLLAQADGPPLGLRADLLQVPAGWQVNDIRQLPPHDGLPDHILLGAYDFASSQRYPATIGDGRRLPDDALSIDLLDCRL